MAEPPSSSSSESEVEENAEQFSNTFDEEVKLDVLQSSSSESDSDPDSHSYSSLFSVFKPGHVPGTSGSHVPISLDTHTETGLDDTDKDVRLGDTNDLSVGRGDERNEDEERSNSAKTDETDQDIGPSCNLKSSELFEQQKHEQNSAEDIQTTVTARVYHSADSLRQVTDQACVKPPPPPKPIFKVADNRKLIIDSREEEEIKLRTITSSEDVCNKTQTGEDISETDLKSYIGEDICPVNHPDVADLYGAIETKDNGNSLTEDVKDAHESIQKPNDETFIDHGAGNDFMMSQRDVIITESMGADIPYHDHDGIGFQTSLTGYGSFEVLEESDDDKEDEEEEKFSTPTEHLSDDEHDEMVDTKKDSLNSDKVPSDQFEKHIIPSAGNAVDTLTSTEETSMKQNKDNEIEMEEKDPTSTTKTDSSQFGESFIVIVKGSFKESKHEYKSISSSVSESDLQKLEENLPIDKDNQCDDNSGSRLSFGDKLKMFEKVPSGQSQQKTKTNGSEEKILVGIPQVKIKNYREEDDDIQNERFKEEVRIKLDNSFHQNLQKNSEQETTDTRIKEEGTESEVSQTKQIMKDNGMFASASQLQAQEEGVVSESETVQMSVTEANYLTQEKGSSYSESGEASDENGDILPPVPPKSAIVLQELESMRALNQEAYQELEDTTISSAMNLDSRDQMYDTVKTEDESNSNQHTVNQEKSEDGQFNSYATQWPTSLPQPQLHPVYPGNQWEYYPPSSAGYYPGNQPYYDAETLDRMKTDPHFAQYIYYQQWYQQQLFYRGQMGQGHSMGQNVPSNTNQRNSYDKEGQPSDQGLTPAVAEHNGQTFVTASFQTPEDAKQTNASHTDDPSQKQQSYAENRDSIQSETQDKSHLKQAGRERSPMVDKGDGRQKEQQTLHTGDTGSSIGKAKKAKLDNPEVHQRTKQTAPPVPKPRKSVGQKKAPYQSLPHTERNKGHPKDTGISQPRKGSERKNTGTLSPGARYENKSVVMQKTTAKLRQFSQKLKVNPVASAAPQAKSKEVKEKPKEDTFIFVKNINQNSSTENLENFLEGGAGNDAEVKDDTTIYSRDRTEALIIFTGKPEMTELNKRCNQKTLDGNYLTICEVPAPTCIAVSSDEDIQSTDALALYFEVQRNGGGELATDEVLESNDASCKIIQFKSSEVVIKLCTGGYHHVVSRATLKVSPYYRCEQGEIWDTALHYIPLPESHTIQIPKTTIQYLSRQCCQELKEDLSNKYADMEFIDSGVTMKCSLTQRTPNCRSLARTWTSDVQKAYDTFMSKLSEKTLEVKNHVWQGVSGFLEKGELEKDTLLIEQQKDHCQIFLYGLKAEVEQAYYRLSSVLNEVDRKVRRTSDTVSFKSSARGRLLQSMGTLVEIEGSFTDLNIELEDKTIRLEGVPEDISVAVLKVHEANSEIISEKVGHNFSNTLVDFLNQVERKNNVIHTIKEQLKENDVSAEFEITNFDCSVFVPPGNQCQVVKDVIFDLVKEEEIRFEKESIPLLKEQKWEDINEDLTERYEKTADVSVNERDRVVHIVGMKEFVVKAKEIVEIYFEENTIKTEKHPWDELTQKFIKRYSRDNVNEIEKKLSEHQVSIKLKEKEALVQATKRGLQLAKQELTQLFSKICHKDHTFQKVGVTEVMNNITMQLPEIESKTRCIIESPTMFGTIYSRPDPYQPEDYDGAAWHDIEDEDDLGRTSSSVDEPPGFKAKNGLRVTLVKGEIGKQEGSVIVCATSPNMNLASGAAGKSLLREGGHTLQDECKEIIANQENIKHGEIVKIRGGKIECKYIYLTLLPNWRDDSTSLQILEDIIRDCLQKASREDLVSILFCALGTGGLKYPAEEVAAVMYSKVLEFDAANNDTSLKEVKFVLYQKDTTTIKAFEKEERLLRHGVEKITYDVKFQNTNVALVMETLATQKVDCIFCTTNKEMNLKASGACNALLAAGGPTLQDECKNKHGNNLPEGQVVEITGGKMKCKSVFLTSLPSYTEESDKTLKSVIQTALKLAQAKKYKSLACIALGTGYLKYPRKVAAKCMYTAVEEFVTANPSTSLQQIKFVMHAKDRQTIEAFRAYVRGSKLTTTRKDRKLEAGKSSRNIEANSDYNAFHDGCQIRQITLKVITGDILEQNTEGIVSSVNEEFKFLGGVATALKSRCPGLEQESRRKALKMKSTGVATTDRSKHGGDLKADYIIHVAFQRSLDKWKSKFRQCLETAEKKKLKSLSIPVLGTGAGSQSFKPEEITGCLFDAIDEFSAFQKQTRLKELRFVIFHKQKFMMDPIIKSIHRKTQNAVMALQQKASSWTSKLKGVTSSVTSKVTAFFTGTGKVATQRQHTKEELTSIREEISSINLKVYSDNTSNIDKCIQEIDLALEQEYTDYTLSDYKELIKSLTEDEMKKLDQIECVVDMKTDQPAGIIRIKGPKKFVLDAQTELHKCLKDFERDRQHHEEAETLYQLIQWQFEEVKADGIELVPYDQMTNLKIENAYKHKKPHIELMDFTDNTVYVVDFLSLEEYIKGEKESSATVVVRKDILKSAKLPLPQEWTPMKDDENIRITNLVASDPVYQQMEKRFVTEVTSGQFNNRVSSMKNVKCTKIDRIQNKALYQQYAAKKELMMKQTPNPPAQFPIERTVWHGTSQAAVSSIQVHGFNRSYAGDKNGDPWFGNGVYFAGDASYSARSWLSGANATGDGTTKGYIFLVKALSGEFCKGTQGMRFLPPKNPSNPTILYDSAVDNIASPMEFVIFHDAQAYPEYIITFVS